MQLNRKAAIAAVVVISVAGLAGTAFAAAISGLGARNAGQGTGTFAGYTAGAVNFTGGWTNTSSNDTSTNVADAVFNLKKAADGAGASTVTQANTFVYAQLLTTGSPSNWVACTVGTSPVAGTVTCPFTSEGVNISTVSSISIVAYDK